jgi:hypothetical protein
MEVSLILGNQDCNDRAISNTFDALCTIEAGAQLALGNTYLSSDPLPARSSRNLRTDVLQIQAVCLDLLSGYVELSVGAVGDEVSQDVANLRPNCCDCAGEFFWRYRDGTKVSNREEIARYFAFKILIKRVVFGQYAPAWMSNLMAASISLSGC